ncbi:hypothetical protein Aph01nite_50300 [Acrocarpospora phusangensis]|uniref:DUF4037 domain-containing protein n=1 Tax=Acrocarpospora phusangensis TaxID=1070424 RepID=A0A919USS1_9ACTN|nr:DUF4037 domain-containing protein [Acrocarpospora phusangensis]GIH26720.1 hypothetical protein Aph01nite_50300 [Acrocarpospora phusangensis]
MMSSFVPGLELSRAFYREVVEPLLGGVAHGAALVGPGSEVLGFDTARSADHDWGPRVLVFVAPGMVEGVRESVWSRLPPEFGGYPVLPPGVEVAEFGPWARALLGFDPRGVVTVEDWRSAPWQRLAEVTSGEVFHDGLGELAAARDGLRWYPPDVWRYVLACQWVRIAQEEAFPGRAAEVGDDLGSLLSTGRLVRDLMRLSLLMRRRYPPYGKWLGSAFKRLSGSAELGEALGGALRAGDWREREELLCVAYRRVAGVQNRLGLCDQVDGSVRPYFARPFRVIGGMRFAEALMASVSDPAVRALPPVGTVDQFSDSTDALMRSDRARSLAAAVR